MSSEHTAGHAQFLVGTFVLTKGHSSTAVVPAGLVGEGEHFGQPTAGRKKPETQGSEGPLGCLGWLSGNSNKLTTCLLVVQEAAWKEREI